MFCHRNSVLIGRRLLTDSMPLSIRKVLIESLVEPFAPSKQISESCPRNLFVLGILLSGFNGLANIWNRVETEL